MLVYERRTPLGKRQRLIPLADLDPQIAATSRHYTLASLAQKRPVLMVQKTPMTSIAIQALQQHVAGRSPRLAQEQAALAGQLEQLEALRRSGTLTDKEYTAAKQRLLTQRSQAGFRGVS